MIYIFDFDGTLYCDGKVNEDATNTHETLGSGMQGTADEFAHGNAPEGLAQQARLPVGIKS